MATNRTSRTGRAATSHRPAASSPAPETIDDIFDLSAYAAPVGPADTSLACRRKSDRGWPAQVPLLSAAELCWNYSVGERRHDLLEWLHLVFDPADGATGTDELFRSARKALCAVLAERLGEKEVDLWDFLERSYRGRSPSLGWQAAAWNEAMYRLGYDVPPARRTPPAEGNEPARPGRSRLR